MGVKFGDRCVDCGVEITPINAYFDRQYIRTRCTSCFKAYRGGTYARSKEARAAYYMKWKYGITTEQYQEKLKEQEGVCAICKKECEKNDRLSIDHDHETGKNRDLLCSHCNLLVGLVEENRDLWEKIIEYVERHMVSKSAF